MPGVVLKLNVPQLPGSWVELLCHAADADGRAAMFGVPALTTTAVASRGPGAVQQDRGWRSKLLQQVGEGWASAGGLWEGGREDGREALQGQGVEEQAAAAGGREKGREGCWEDRWEGG